MTIEDLFDAHEILNIKERIEEMERARSKRGR